MLKENQEFDKAVNAFRSAHNFAIAHGLAEQFVELTIGYGIAMYKNGDIQNAHSILLEVLPKIDHNELKLRAEVNQIVGMTLVFKDKFSEGYKYQMEALKYYSDINDPVGLMSVYYDLGANFSTQGSNELALKNYEKGIELAKAANDKKMTILGITAIGGTYATMNNFEKALEYIDESMVLAKQLNDNEELAWASINRGHISSNLEWYEQAEFYLTQAYELSFIIGNKLLTAYALEQMSDLYFKQDQMKKAIVKLDESFDIYQELGQTNNMKSVTKKYAEIYFKQKDFSKYKEFTDKYIALKDSLYSKENMEAMTNLKQDFELRKMERENQIVLLTKDQELTRAKNQATIAITCAAATIFILLLLLMYSRNKAAIEKNEILTAKNSEILRQNEILANSNRDLEKFAYIISHDLKEPLRNINGFTKLLNRKIKKYTTDQDIGEYASFITNSTEQMAALLNGLLEYSKIGVNKSEMEVADLNKLVRQVTNSLKIQLDEKNCDVHVNNLPNIVCRSTQITQVFQNLVANAIKYCGDKGNEITISAEDLGDKYRFHVKDKGIGIDDEYQKDIFIVFKRLHDRGRYSGSGIGLATCKKIVEDHGGEIWVKSMKGVGSCFYFTLPKDQNSDLKIHSNVSTSKVSELVVI